MEHTAKLAVNQSYPEIGAIEQYNPQLRMLKDSPVPRFTSPYTFNEIGDSDRDEDEQNRL
jgi:hypothetical protein